MPSEKPEIVIEADQVKVVAERDVNLYPNLTDDQLGRLAGIGPTPKVQGVWYFRALAALLALAIVITLGGAFFGAWPMF